jgi:hypothetical protein
MGGTNTFGMNALILRDDEHALVLADVELGLFRLTWKGYVPGHNLRRILIQAVMQVQQHRLRFWLSDSRSLGAILHEDEVWIKDELMPQLLRMGVERLAIIMSQDFFTRMSTDRLVDQGRPNAPFAVQMFDSAANAEQWLFAPKVAVA